MPLVDRKYKANQTLFKVYGEGDNRKIKLISMKALRTNGIEDEDELLISDRGVNDNKLDNNIQRARAKIFELAYCNEWDYFFTGTLDKSKYDRSDLEKFHADFSRWIRNLNSHYGLNIKYLVVPELHADGKNWHIHGLLAGVPDNFLKQFKLGDKMGKYIASKVLSGNVVYDFPKYSKKFGFCDLEPIKNHEAVCKYVTKYMNKELGKSVSDIGAHMYYRSRGLNTAYCWARGFSNFQYTPDYENDYCKVVWLDYSEELFSQILTSFQDFIPIKRSTTEFEEI